MDEVMQNAKAEDPQTFLLLIKRGGTVARSPLQNCRAMKTLMRMPKATNSPIMVPLFQSYSDPPHCIASNRQTVPGRKTDILIRSSCESRSANPCVCLIGSRAGKKREMKTAVTAPRGRLI